MIDPDAHARVRMIKAGKTRPIPSKKLSLESFKDIKDRALGSRSSFFVFGAVRTSRIARALGTMMDPSLVIWIA